MSSVTIFTALQTVQKDSHGTSSQPVRNTDAQKHEEWKPMIPRWVEMLVLKKLPIGNLDKSTLVSKLCEKEFAHHIRTCSLRYHLSARHARCSRLAPATGLAGAASVAKPCMTRRQGSEPTNVASSEKYSDESN